MLEYHVYWIKIRLYTRMALAIYITIAISDVHSKVKLLQVKQLYEWNEMEYKLFYCFGSFSFHIFFYLPFFHICSMYSIWIRSEWAYSLSLSFSSSLFVTAPYPLNLKIQTYFLISLAFPQLNSSVQFQQFAGLFFFFRLLSLYFIFVLVS